MAREPYKDPFANLPRRSMFVDASAADQPKREKKPDMKELAEMVVEACAKADAVKRRGPKKGAGGRPKKTEGVSTRTQRRRKAASPA
jgi:hypothetical protein